MELLKRILSGLWKTVVVTLLFVVALVASAVLHLSSAPGLRVVKKEVNANLGTLFVATLDLRAIRSVGLFGVSGVDARVVAPNGVEIISASDVSARVNVFGILKSLLLDDGPMVIRIDEIRVPAARVSLDRDAEGNLLVAKAFELRKPSPPPPPNEPKGRAVDVMLPRIEAGKVHVVGEPTSGLPLDADITDIFTTVSVAEPGVEVRLVRAKLDTLTPEIVPGKPKAVAALWISSNLSIPSVGFGPLAFDAQVLGTVGGITLATQAAMRGDVIRAQVLVPTTSGESIAVFTGAPLRGPLSVRGLVFGPLERLAFTVHAGLAGGGAQANGVASIADTKSVVAHVAARHVDLYTFGSVASNLQADVDAAIVLPPGKDAEPSGFVRAHAFDSAIQEVPLPSVDAFARMTNGHFVLNARVDEPGVPAALHAEGSAKTPITFTADAHINTGAVERVKLPVRGIVDLRVGGTIDPNTQILNAGATVSAQNLDAAGVKIASVIASAKATGKAAAPQIVATVKAGNVSTGNMQLTDVSAGATVLVGSPIRIEDVRASASSHGETALVLASRVELGEGGSVRARDVNVNGLGEPIRISGSYSPTELAVSVQGRRINLARIGRIMSIDELGGDASITADVRSRGQDLQGTVSVGLERGSFDTIRGAHAQVEAAIEDRKVSLRGSGNLGRAGKFEIDGSDLHLSGPALAPHAFEHIYGTVALDVDVELARLPRFVPQMRGRDVLGTLKLSGHVARHDGHALPDAMIAAQTYNLSFSLPPPPIEGETATPIRRGLVVAGIDVALDVHVDTASGFAGVATRLHDKVGTIVSLDAKTIVPVERLYKVATETPSDLVTHLLDTEVNAKLVVPERDIQAFPSILGLGAMRGKAAATLDLAGTARAPRLGLAATGRNVRDAETGARFAADVDTKVTYDGNELAVDVTALSGPKGRALVRARVTGKSADFLTARDPLEVPWAANLRVDLDAFPLQFIPTTSGQKIRGEVTGFAAVDDLHRNAAITSKLDFSDVRIARASFPKIAFTAATKNGSMDASVRLMQKDGSASIDAKGGLDWGAKLVPSVSTKRALEARLLAKNLNAAAFLPFVSALSDLDGRINADATVIADADGKNVKMQGGIDFRDGILGIPAVGQEFREAKAKITLLPNGTVQLVEASAKDATGEFKLVASAHFNDLVFANAEAALSIAKDSPLDMAVQGQSLGEVWGQIKVRVAASKDGSNFVANVAIPSLHAKLAESGTRSLQALDGPENIYVGTMSRGVFVGLPRTASDFNGGEQAAPAAKTTVTVNLAFGDDVEVRQGSLFQARFTGKLGIVSSADLVVRGQLNVTGGNADLQGKKFEIQKGTVTFNGSDPTNPVVVATAGWVAGDRTRVYADFVGPVRTGVVTLRSEPARTKSEIFALVVFGTADGMGGSGGGGQKPGAATQAATTVAGSQVGRGIDKALDDIAGLETQTRIDTTNANNPKPELELFISRTVSLQFAHVLGTPPMSSPDVNLGTVKWRFAPRWSLATTFGDRGKAAVDTLWNYLY